MNQFHALIDLPKTFHSFCFMLMETIARVFRTQSSIKQLRHEFFTSNVRLDSQTAFNVINAPKLLWHMFRVDIFPATRLWTSKRTIGNKLSSQAHKKCFVDTSCSRSIENFVVCSVMQATLTNLSEVTHSVVTSARPHWKPTAFGLMEKSLKPALLRHLARTVKL